MATRDPNVAHAISEIANSTQVLIGIAEQLKSSLTVASEDAVKLEAQVDRTVRALRQLQQQEGA